MIETLQSHKRMKKINQTLMKFPEYYLIVLVILVGYTPPFSFHVISILLGVGLIAQIIFKNKISGLIIASLFFLMTLFMLGALISELNEFTEFNSNAKQLLFGGLSLWFLNVLFSVVMLYKYATLDKTKNPQTKFNTQDV